MVSSSKTKPYQFSSVTTLCTRLNDTTPLACQLHGNHVSSLIHYKPECTPHRL